MTEVGLFFFQLTKNTNIKGCMYLKNMRGLKRKTMTNEQNQNTQINYSISLKLEQTTS